MIPARGTGLPALAGRALLLGACVGTAVGAVEADLHLATWKLYADRGAAASFVALAASLDAAFFAAYAAAGVALVGSVPALRRRLLPDAPRRRGERFLWSWLAFGVAGLFSTVWWKLGLHVNAFITDPVIFLGIPAMLASSAVAGALLGVPLAAGARRWPGFPALVLLPAGVHGLHALLSATPEPPAKAADGTARRVLFVTLDTTRPDRIGAYGNGRIRTPHLDRLAREGALFEQAIASAPTTEPSHLSMLSSTFPHDPRNGIAGNGTTLPSDLPMVQEGLRRAGMATAAFVSGFPVTARFGFDRGFDTFDDDFGAPMGLHRLAVVRAADQFLAYGGTPRERTADITGERALAWLRDHARGSFFAWVHFYDPHGPYTAPAPFRGMYDADGPDLTRRLEGEMPEYWPPPLRRVMDADYWIAEYDAEISFVDDWVGRLLGEIERQGVLDDTLVVVTADHGESLTEHGYLFDHGLYLYDAEMLIPLLVRWPGKVPAGVRVPCQVRGLDLSPTILDLLGLPAPDTFKGASLVPLMREDPACGVAPGPLSAPAAGAPPPREAYAATLSSRKKLDPPVDYMVRVEGATRLKYIRRTEGGHQLFDLVADPGEVRDLLAEQPEQARALRGLVDAAASGAQVRGMESDPAMLERLRALGYVDDAAAVAGTPGSAP